MLLVLVISCNLIFSDALTFKEWHAIAFETFKHVHTPTYVLAWCHTMKKNTGIRQVMRLLRSQLSNTATYVIHHLITIMFGWTSAVNCDTNLPQLVGWIHYQLTFFPPKLLEGIEIRIFKRSPTEKWQMVLHRLQQQRHTCAAEIFYFQFWNEGWFIHLGLLLWVPHSRQLILDSRIFIQDCRI